MKKRIIYCISIFLLFTILSINIYLNTKYNISLFQYLSRSNKITKEERNWLEDHGTIIYGTTNNNPPLRYVDKESGVVQGLVIDYITALSIELETEIKLKPLLWNEAVEKLSLGKTDILDMFASPERSKFFLFSDPIYNMRGVIIISNDEKNINSYWDLRNKRVAALKEDYCIEFLKSNVKDIKYLETDDVKDAMLLLKENKVDAVVGDEPVISYYRTALGMKNRFEIIEEPMYEKKVVLAVPKTRKKLLNILNKGIYNLNKRKIMNKIQQKWFGISTPLYKEKVTEKFISIVLIFIAIIFLIAYISYFWNKSLKKEVKKRTEELYISRKDLEITFDGLTNLLIVLNQDCNIINVNKSFCNMVRFNRKEILNNNCKGFPGILCVDCDNCIVKETFKDKRNHQKEINFENKIFEKTTYLLKDTTRDSHRVLVMLKDITKVRVSEQQLLHSNKMVAVGQLAAGVAHEIRNPLGLIRSYCYILKNKKNREDVKIDKALRVIEGSVKKASNTIDNLLNFSRISSNKWEKVNMRDLINSIVKLKNRDMEKRNIEKEIDCEDNLLCYTNTESLKHIIINLLANAIDAIPNRGVVSIKCSIENNKLLIECADNGKGIKKEDIENIFNPFFTTKPRGKGTGMGLYIIYNEVQKLGGEISVDSVLNKGTSFYVTLPLRWEDINEREL